jgi:hypothetical protein
VYRYGDGTPFPLDENFIETLTTAVEACTNAFMPLTQLDHRREQAKSAKVDAERELVRLGELEKTLTSALAPYMVQDRTSAHTQEVAKKTLASAKVAIGQARVQVEGRVSAAEAQSSARTAADAVLHALRPFFDHHALPNSKWIMSWDVRGSEPAADAIATSSRLQASFKLAVEQFRSPIRVDQLADAVIVHMMKKGLFGGAKPAPVELGKYVMVAFERNHEAKVITLKEKAEKASQGLRFTVNDHGATWQSITPGGDAETDPNPLDAEDVDGVRRLGEGANRALKDLMSHRTLVDLSLGQHALGELPEPRAVPMELLAQLTPLARSIRERSRVHGELVLKRDLGGGRREELFVPRAQLSQHFAKLPPEYRRPFEDMGVSGEDTQPAIQLPEQMRPPAKKTSPPQMGAPPAPPPPPRGPHANTFVEDPHDQKTVEVNPNDIVKK